MHVHIYCITLQTVQIVVLGQVEKSLTGGETKSFRIPGRDLGISISEQFKSIPYTSLVA